MVAETISVGAVSTEYEWVVAYLWALVWNWWTLALAILAMNEVFQWQFGKSFRWLHNHKGKIAVAFVILAQTLAYRDLKLDSVNTASPQKFANQTSQDTPIKQQTLRLAAQIREFIRDWKDSDDEAVQRQNVDKYITRFGHTALAVRDSLDQHGVRSPELDKLMFEFSYNYKDVRAIPVELERLANSAPFSMQFEATEKDPQARADLAIAQSEIARLRATVKKFEDQASEQNTREWPPLTSEAEANWINVLAPYNIKLISVHWGQEVECRRF